MHDARRRPRQRGAWISSIAAIILVAACGDGPRADDEPTTAPTSVTATADGTAGDADGGDAGQDGADDAVDGSDGGIKLDVGGPDTAGSADDGGSADECTNVDVLFVIDNSASMADQQQSLIASFPGFVEGMKSNLELAESFHIGVVTSDAYDFNAPGCRGLGDLVTQTGGLESSQLPCGPYTSGARYMDDSEPDLGTAFACAGQVGINGNDDEKMLRATLDALEPSHNDPAGGECNAGFARDDSLLVIVLISDEDDVAEPYGCDPDDFFDNPCDTVGSGGDPDAWVQELAGYKSNIDSNVVVLSLVGLAGGNSCGAVPASKLIGFANRFGANGFTDDVCASSYDEFFANALPIIDQACEDYIPPEG